jgi:NNP family nitrate/nitrite transporter-like MFS transporter
MVSPLYPWCRGHHTNSLSIGIVSGIVGGFGNLGGIVFAIIFRYNGSDYGKSMWIIGVISLVANLAVCWIRPVPKSQMQA